MWPTTFADNPKVKFVVPSGIFAYVDVVEIFTLWHGDTVSYGGECRAYHSAY